MGSGNKGIYLAAVTKSNFLVLKILKNSEEPCDYSSYPKIINKDKQGKHIPGDKNYQLGKSELTISISHAQRLVDTFTGKGQPIDAHKERVDFGETIGIYRDPSGKSQSTTVGIIHYSKTGTHIVPAKPKGKK